VKGKIKEIVGRWKVEDEVGVEVEEDGSLWTGKLESVIDYSRELKGPEINIKMMN
jgi:hypothetical protein